MGLWRRFTAGVFSMCGLLLGLALVACGDRRAAAEGQPAVEERAVAPLEFLVIREGGGGIEATIHKLDGQNPPSLYARVPGSGEVAMDKPCEPGERFQAAPTVEAFHLGPPQECQPRVEFMLLSTLATLQFMKRGDDASSTGDLLAAQVNYGIAADRLQYAKPEQARLLRVLSQVAAGRVLGVTHPVHGADGAEKPTVEFTDRVRQFQKENGIEETGELDARTRESIGRMQMRGNEVVVPLASVATTPADAAAAAAAPALVVTPQAATPPIEVHVTKAEMLALPASPQTVEIIHANRAKASQNQARRPATINTSSASWPAASARSALSPKRFDQLTPRYGANSRRIS